MTPPGRLLAVFAHPDDEALVAGGVLARHAGSGARTRVVTATWAPDGGRAAELADAVRVLGAGAPRMLGYADHRVPDSSPGRPRWTDVPLDEAITRLVAEIREFRPRAVVTHDAYGGLTGHPDHRHTHRVTALAVQAAGLPHLCPEAGAPWLPDALWLATHPHSGVGELGPLLARAGKTVLSVPDELVTATVDVRPWLDRKWRAILAHRSQVDRERPLPGILSRLPEKARHRIISTEYFIRVELRPATRGTGPLPG
ncbi:PIG-L deacetylase family protein [Streptomyces sp. NBC_00059]|uniref:PIG-L deacetylase family protein n=1 Tax=Streptomyces sp. NBC_00059 TaxID=2975635 RepID=UPI002253392D|nr:PIG-L deacetylase family protein [Streptomyces sp. NBC_00059]MCX5412953.1 PIG-L family deacetylase [Streptomyces sp. NBC_00059]